MDVTTKELSRQVNAESERRIRAMLGRWQSGLEPQVFTRNVPMTVVIGSDRYEVDALMPIGLGPVGHLAPCITWGDT